MADGHRIDSSDDARAVFRRRASPDTVLARAVFAGVARSGSAMMNSTPCSPVVVRLAVEMVAEVA